MVRAVLFDLDGVVTDTAELHYEAWQELADRHGLPFDREKNEQLRGVSREASLRLILDDKDVSSEAFDAMLREKNQRYLQLLENIDRSDLLEGMGELLAELGRRGTKTAIASSSRNARSIIRRLELDSLFSVIADGNSVERSKPDPDVFVHAAGQLGVNCRDCIVIEDAAAGIRGAKEAGMSTVGIGDQVREATPDVTFASTADMTLAAIEGRLGEL